MKQFKIFALLASLSSVAFTSEINCEFDQETYGGGYGTVYVCHTQLTVVEDNPPAFTSVTGKHEAAKSDSDVEAFLVFRQKVKSIPDGLNDFFPKLKILVIENSGLTNFEAAKKSRNLKRIMLQYNVIESLDSKSFEGLNKLEEVTLDANKITRIAVGTFDDMPSLKRVSLGKNGLRSLEAGLFKNNLKLEGLEFSNNKLSHIDGDLFRSLKSLTDLSLTNNICIDQSFPDTVSSLNDMIEQVADNCSDVCKDVKEELVAARLRIAELERK